MLAQRIVTALVLVALLVPALLAPVPWPFDLLVLVFIAAAGWEWARLNQAGQSASLLFSALLALACGATLLAGAAAPRAPSPAWWLAAALWCVAGGLALRGGPSGWPRLPRSVRWLLGLLMLWAGWLALVQARGIGINFVLSLFCLVWAADISAYFGGRRFGKRKLAPSISPGKTWEGVASGMLGVLLLAWAWSSVETRFAVDSPSLYRELHAQLGLAGAALALLVLAGISVVGDLVESLVKRAAGAKDSSGLLPGHGGVLDRIDALLPVLPVAMAMMSL